MPDDAAVGQVAHGKLARYAALSRAMAERAGPLVSVLLAGALAPGLTVDRARDLIWLHTAPDTYRLLVLERGWALDEYERWFATSLAAALLPPPARPTSS